MKFKKQLYLITTFLLLQSCNSLGGNNMGFGSNNNWQTYETKIGDVILQYALPGGQSRNSPKIGVPKAEINIPVDVESIFDGFWDFSSSRFKSVDGSLYCSIGVSNLNNKNIIFKNNKIDFESFKEYLFKTSYKEWKIRNTEWLKKADYLTPLKYRKPSGFEEVTINDVTWYKFFDPHLTYVYPVNKDGLIGITIYKAFGSANKKLNLQADQMIDKIIKSLKIKKIIVDQQNKSITIY